MKQAGKVLLVLAVSWGCAPVGGHEDMARRGHDGYAVGAKGVLGVGLPPAPAWTSTGPDSTDYNEETHIEGSPYTAEQLLAGCWCLMLASAPLLLAALAEKELTRAHMLESVTLIAWFGSVLFLFTWKLKFQSSHWEGTRPLTLPEAVYLLSQILTTVGYGDITPAFPRGQVWVGFNVILALCLYGSIICEVIGVVGERLAKAFAENSGIACARQPNQPMRDWRAELEVTYTPLIQSAGSFLGTAFIGVLFWHYYPGEGKTWLQAVYMSVITLSTVGFGAFNATTEGGKVFGAFWMLVGVATLGALISTFIQTMMEEKKAEKRRSTDIKAEFQEFMFRACGGAETMDKAQFLKFGLLLTKGVDPAALRSIEVRFDHLIKQSGAGKTLRRTTLVDIEGPL